MIWTAGAVSALLALGACGGSGDDRDRDRDRVRDRDRDSDSGEYSERRDGGDDDRDRNEPDRDGGPGRDGELGREAAPPSGPPASSAGMPASGAAAGGGGARVLAANDSSNDAISMEWMSGSWSPACGTAPPVRFTPQSTFRGTIQGARGSGTYQLGGGAPLTIRLTIAGTSVDGNIARMDPETMALRLPGAPTRVLKWCGP
jgi:hypothetical protein